MTNNVNFEMKSTHLDLYSSFIHKSKQLCVNVCVCVLCVCVLCVCVYILDISFIIYLFIYIRGVYGVYL